MSRKNSYLTVTDQFCGAGGSSQGVRKLSRKIGGGFEVKLAMNHWRLAIEIQIFRKRSMIVPTYKQLTLDVIRVRIY